MCALPQGGFSKLVVCQSYDYYYDFDYGVDQFTCLSYARYPSVENEALFIREAEAKSWGMRGDALRGAGAIGGSLTRSRMTGRSIVYVSVVVVPARTCSLARLFMFNEEWSSTAVCESFM